MRNRIIVVTLIGLAGVVAVHAITRDSTAPTTTTTAAAPEPERAPGSRKPGQPPGASVHPVAPRHAPAAPALGGVDARAEAVIARGGAFRDATGAPLVPLAQQFDDVATFATALQSARQALDAVDPGSAAHADLERKVKRLHDAMTRTRLALLQEWSSEVRAGVTMTAEERAQLAAIIDAQAQVIATAAQPDPARTPSSKIQALLGTERYTQYENRRRAFFPTTMRMELVLP